MTDGKRIEQTEVFAVGLESESKGQSEGKGWGSYLNQESKSELLVLTTRARPAIRVPA